MLEFLDILPHKLRFLLGGLLVCCLVIINLVLFSTFTSELHTHRIHMTLAAWTSGTANSPITLTKVNSKTNMQSVGWTSGILGRAARDSGEAMAIGGRSVAKTVGTVFARTGEAIGYGATSVARVVESGITSALHVPGKLIASITGGHVVGSIIRPADKESVPVINAETSSSILARLNASERQEAIQLQAAQLAANQALDGQIVAGDPNHGGYPAKWADAPQDSLTDSWGMYNRECVSYVAWKVYQTFGSMPYWGGVGNANEWVQDAARSGIATGTTPRVHSVAISLHGYYGHAMWVEKVSGNMIYVSQYNYDLQGHYSEMWVNGSTLTYIYFN